MSDAKYWVLFFIAVISVAVFTAYTVHKQDEARIRENEKKILWYKDHNCVRTSYVGNSRWAVYTCSNGEVYTWEDMPMKESK